MSEIRSHAVSMTGRMAGDPISHQSGRVYFRFNADLDQEPFQCFCDGQTAANMLINLRDGDEFQITGNLQWVQFSQGPAVLLVFARWTSYGRKARTLR